MELSAAGKIADGAWRGIPAHADNTALREFVIMPNHIHGIIEITKMPTPTPIAGAPSIAGAFVGRGKACLAPTTAQTRFQNPGKNTLFTIIGSYKSTVSREIHRAGIDFAWQRNYYEHIIRDDADYSRIARYIENNPKQWDTNIFNQCPPP